ncbi:tyrosine recombinase XerC [Candidatus Kinetoplastidibacterium galati]|uniref:Tyrosine recombinase XerC n=1 Tax=Candidatus Kinetoplastidibacterium galati TCC219 TaxID=1208921 RepID=M1LZ91_9PROT|nr:tyrosine recombinase XerC [Candidatus Kinetoplastibacterium galatii]AGF49381.1 integrase/recombinase XerC [Candidatus Kinetoplastibacterium galatii TCC219]
MFNLYRGIFLCTKSSNFKESSLKKPLNDWLLYIYTNLRYSKNTFNNYKHDISLLDKFVRENSISLEEITTENVRSFFSKRYSNGIGPRGIARTLSAWKSFYDWWGPRVNMSHNPVSGIRSPKAARPLPKSLSVDQMKNFLDRNKSNAEKSFDPIMLRDQAILELLYSSGLRLSELISIDIKYENNTEYKSTSWIDLRQSEVVVLGKGNKQRKLPIGNSAIESIKKWVGLRDRFVLKTSSLNDRYALFLGIKGKRISPRVIQMQLLKLSKNLTMSMHISPHMIRHSFASHLLQSSQNLRAVQELLGHKTISTTQIYTKLDFQHLASVYDKTHPRAIRKK